MQLRRAEEALRDGRDFLVGRRFTTADLMLTTRLTWALDYGVPVTPACLAYAALMKSRLAYRAAAATIRPRST